MHLRRAVCCAVRTCGRREALIRAWMSACRVQGRGPGDMAGAGRGQSMLSMFSTVDTAGDAPSVYGGARACIWERYHIVETCSIDALTLSSSRTADMRTESQAHSTA